MVFKRGNKAAGRAVVRELLPSPPDPAAFAPSLLLERYLQVPPSASAALQAGRMGQSPMVSVRVCVFGMTC